MLWGTTPSLSALPGRLTAEEAQSSFRPLHTHKRANASQAFPASLERRLPSALRACDVRTGYLDNVHCHLIPA